MLTAICLVILNARVYLAPLWRYGASNIMGSRPWPFGVTWRHRSREIWFCWKTTILQTF